MDEEVPGLQRARLRFLLRRLRGVRRGSCAQLETLLMTVVERAGEGCRLGNLGSLRSGDALLLRLALRVCQRGSEIVSSPRFLLLLFRTQKPLRYQTLLVPVYFLQ